MPDQVVPNLDLDQIPTKLGDSEITEYRSEDGMLRRVLASIQILDQNGQIMDVWQGVLYSNNLDIDGQGNPEEHLDVFRNAELLERNGSHERLRAKAATAWNLVNEVPA